MQDDENPTTADMEEDDMVDAGQAKKTFYSTCSPTIGFCKRLMEDRLQSVGYIVGMSTLSHPALPLACRLTGADCFIGQLLSTASITPTPFVREAR